MFLKEFKNTIPLISKMYFKDSFSQEAKGFDAVHVSQDSLTLWLGETKFYKAWKTKGVVKGGIDELVEDLKKHITKDYLSEQYVIIKRGLETQLEHPQREEWIEKLSRPILLKDVFQYIRIPLLCIYEDDIALDYLKAIDDAVKDAGIVSHTATLRDYYNSINTFPYREQVQTVLILMPIEAKKKLVKCMLEKIWHMQNIEQEASMDFFQQIDNIALLEPAAHFELFRSISNALNSKDSGIQAVGRNHLIKVIDVWEDVPSTLKPMWEDLIEAVGFYPYIEKYKMTLTDLDARIRQEYHRSEYIFDKTLHSKQKELSDLILSKQNVVVSAPTSFGKSLLIEEIVASGIYTNIVIIQPTLALLDETRIKLKRYFDQYKVIVRTSQSASTEKGNIFLLTAERVLEYPDMPDIELLIIDEFYKLSKQREDNRANILNIAFLRLMKNPSCRFYLLGPNIDNISPGFLEKYNAVFYKTDYSLVYTETENLYDTVKKKPGGKVSYEDIFAVLDATEDQSLIFCSSPSTARKLAFAYSNHLEAQGNEQNTDIPLIQWINENLGVEWSLAHCLSNGIGIHDGSMPKHITVSTIKYFNDQKLKFLFCTNTIIEGVNTSAKNVIYYDSKIGTRDVDYFDYANIRGRAGRLMEHCVGRVINLKKPPQAKEMSVDIPAYTQNPIDDEVLVNIEKAEVKPFNMERYQRFENLPEELKIILKRNAVSIKDQLELLPIIRAMLIDPHRRGDIVWSELRDRNLYNHLCIIFDLVKDRFVEGNDKNVLISTKWMATQTVSYIYNKNIRQMIVERVAYRAKEYLKKNVPNSEDMHFSSQQFMVEYPEMARQFADEAVETIFKFQKNWLQYKIPKWLNVVDSLQKYIAAELGMEAGDYSFIAEAIENEFTAANIQILTEFGIPSSAIRKILDRYGHHLKGLTEDQVVAAIIRNRELINRCLSVYEIEALERCL